MANTAGGKGGNGDRGLIEALGVIFACQEDTARVIGQRASERRFQPRTMILRQGDKVAETYLMISGKVHSLVVGGDGQQMLLSEFGPGDIFGAVGQADPASQADIVSVELARTALYLAMDFLMLIERHGCVAVAVSRMLTRQLQDARRRMVEEVTLTAKGRVCAELLRLADAGDGRRIAPPPVVTALALRVHTTRETASRTLGELERRKIIQRERDALVIVSRRSLGDEIL